MYCPGGENGSVGSEAFPPYALLLSMASPNVLMVDEECVLIRSIFYSNLLGICKGIFVKYLFTLNGCMLSTCFTLAEAWFNNYSKFYI